MVAASVIPAAPAHSNSIQLAQQHLNPCVHRSLTLNLFYNNLINSVRDSCNTPAIAAEPSFNNLPLLLSSALSNPTVFAQTLERAMARCFFTLSGERRRVAKNRGHSTMSPQLSLSRSVRYASGTLIQTYYRANV